MVKDYIYDLPILIIQSGPNFQLWGAQGQSKYRPVSVTTDLVYDRSFLLFLIITKNTKNFS